MNSKNSPRALILCYPPASVNICGEIQSSDGTERASSSLCSDSDEVHSQTPTGWLRARARVWEEDQSEPPRHESWVRDRVQTPIVGQARRGDARVTESGRESTLGAHSHASDPSPNLTLESRVSANCNNVPLSKPETDSHRDPGRVNGTQTTDESRLTWRQGQAPERPQLNTGLNFSGTGWGLPFTLICQFAFLASTQEVVFALQLCFHI